MDLLLVFLLILLGAGLLGWRRDSRDFADWRPSDGGLRRPPREACHDASCLQS